MNVKQELHCHNCDRYVQFELDYDIDDNYVIKCPNCGHEHYRVIKDGEITDERWGSSNQIVTTGNFTVVSSSSSTLLSTFRTYGGASVQTHTTGSFLYCSWTNVTTIN